MAVDLNPELRPFVLSNVTLTGTRIGVGAYGSVDEVVIPVCGAAKKIHDIFLDRSSVSQDVVGKMSTQFVKECQLMSTLRHPNIVQFLGVCFFPGSRLPAPVMERLLTSLHDLLDPETRPPPGTPPPPSFFKLGLKCSVLHNVASGLDYLHHQTPPIIHRDLSARNILLNSSLVGKIADLGVACEMPHAATRKIMAPGALIYMPPEAIAPSSSDSTLSKYDASIDIFSLGVVTIFTVGETFPCDPLAPTYTNMETGMLVARTELQRRSEYMRNVHTKLRGYGQHHPLIELIQQCLHDNPHKRPNISEVLGLLEESKADIKEWEIQRNKVELLQALQHQPRNQVRDCIPIQYLTQCACAVRVTVLGLCVCPLYHISPLELRFVLKILSRTQRATEVVEFSLEPLCCRDPALLL